MHVNKEFGKIVENGAIEYAPKAVKIGGYILLHPTAEEYAVLGYVPVVDERPAEPAPEGYHYEARGWEESGGAIRRVYEAIPKPLPTVDDFDNAMEEYLRTEREARGYTTREPDAYLSSSNPRWAQDAKDWVAHRDTVMAYALDLMNAVESGEREPPTLDEFLAIMPRIMWTYGEV